MSLNHERLQGQNKCIFSGLSPSIDDSMWRRRRKGQRERESEWERKNEFLFLCSWERKKMCESASAYPCGCMCVLLREREGGQLLSDQDCAKSSVDSWARIKNGSNINSQKLEKLEKYIGRLFEKTQFKVSTELLLLRIKAGWVLWAQGPIASCWI